MLLILILLVPVAATMPVLLTGAYRHPRRNQHCCTRYLCIYTVALAASMCCTHEVFSGVKYAYVPTLSEETWNRTQADFLVLRVRENSFPHVVLSYFLPLYKDDFSGSAKTLLGSPFSSLTLQVGADYQIG